MDPPVAADLDFDLEFDVKLSESTVLGQALQPLPPSPDTMPTNLGLDNLVEDVVLRPDSLIDEPAGPMASIDFALLALVAKPTEVMEARGATNLTPDAQQPAKMEVDFNDQIAIKLDLANAYVTMGDPEGAYELLQEVLNEGNAPQREKAQAILSGIDPESPDN